MLRCSGLSTSVDNAENAIPRICSVMSLNPYFGSLIPVLKEMTKAFCKFLPVIVVLCESLQFVE